MKPLNKETAHLRKMYLSPVKPLCPSCKSLLRYTGFRLWCDTCQKVIPKGKP